MPHGGSSHKIVTFSFGMLRERQRRHRLNPYVCIHRGHEEEALDLGQLGGGGTPRGEFYFLI